MQSTFVRLGALFGFLSVAIGALGRHALEARLDPHSLDIFDIAARYQTTHALALILVGLLAGTSASKRLSASGWLFAFGIVVFSGSLYALALTSARVLGAITPLGGLSFMAAWILLLFAAGERTRQQGSS